MTDTSHPNLHDYVDAAAVDALIQQARDEDLGPDCVDVTTSICIADELNSEAKMTSRTAGCVSGLALLPAVVEAYDPNVKLTMSKQDGDRVEPGDTLATLEGSLASILKLERIALNFTTHLSGIASLTRQFVDRIAAVPSSQARICDTRKTLPGWRGLQKYAVVCGGGTSHRIGLYDAMLIKDNHIAHLPANSLGDAVRLAVERGRAAYPNLKFIEVEVDRLDQLEQVLGSGVDMVLLDNMPPATLRQAVTMRDRLAPAVLLEASGGVNLDTVAEIAATGVERISVGALTHSPPSLDIGLDMA